MPNPVASSRRLFSGVLASAAFAMLVLACSGGGGKPSSKIATPNGRADAGASAQLATSPPPSGLPPMASMPAPGVAGSKKAKRRPDAALATCAGASKPQAKDPADLVKKLGEGCAGSSKMKPTGAAMRGQQGDREPHQEHKFRGEAGHCYRVYFATDDSVKDVVVVLRDSAGDIIAESPGPAVPEEGSVCFASADEVSVLVGIGSGRGVWVAQVWSD